MRCEVEVYLRKGIVYVPTMGKMDEGFIAASSQRRLSLCRTPTKFGKHCMQQSRGAIRSYPY